MLIEAVGIRFGAVQVCSGEVQFPSDNGAYRAQEAHAVAREPGITPVHTPVCSPQLNGMQKESWFNFFKRDYVTQMDRSTAAIVLAQLPDAFTHFNEVHQQAALKLKWPRMYRRELVRQAQENDAN